MFKLELDIPTYAEWKVQIEKLLGDKPFEKNSVYFLILNISLKKSCQNF